MTGHIEGHTVLRYDGELNHVHGLVLDLGRLVLIQLGEALAAFAERDLAKAHRVVAWDHEVDRQEVAADREIAELIARRSPVGRDLRMVMALSKATSDLERMGDEAVRIAGVILEIFGDEGSDPGSRLLRDVGRMGGMALAGLQGALRALETWNAETAAAVIAGHQEMEEEFRSDLRRLITYVIEDARNVGFVIQVVLAMKSLERIGHHAQNLAEYVVFQVKGEDVRAAEATPPPAPPGD